MKKSNFRNDSSSWFPGVSISSIRFFVLFYILTYRIVLLISQFSARELRFSWSPTSLSNSIISLTTANNEFIYCKVHEERGNKTKPWQINFQSKSFDLWSHSNENTETKLKFSWIFVWKKKKMFSTWSTQIVIDSLC